MSLTSTANRNDYVGNGATSVYPYSWKAFENTDLRVTVATAAGVETTLTLTTDYTVSGVGAVGGGSITLVNTLQAWLTGGFLTTGFALTIRRVMPLTQETDIRNQGDFFPEIHEDEFDRGVMVAQQQQDELARSLKLPETEAGTAALVLPSEADRASKFLAFDAAANPIASSGGISGSVPVSAFMETVLDDTTAAAARTTLGFPASAGLTGQVLKQGGAIEWAYPYSRVSKVFANSPYTILSTDTHVDVDTSGGAVTVTVPAAAAGNSGQTVWVRKTTSDFTAVTLASGVSTTLNTQGECAQIQSNGTAWAIIARHIPSVWTAYTPTIGPSTNTTAITGFWKRKGDSVEIEVRWEYNGANASNAAFSATIPTGLTIDTAKLTSTGVTREFGKATMFDSGSAVLNGTLVHNNATSVYALVFLANLPYVASTTTNAQSGIPMTPANGDFILFTFSVPITNWNG